jgi:hypothetical protein
MELNHDSTTINTWETCIRQAKLVNLYIVAGISEFCVMTEDNRCLTIFRCDTVGELWAFLRGWTLCMDNKPTV